MSFEFEKECLLQGAIRVETNVTVMLSKAKGEDTSIGGTLEMKGELERSFALLLCHSFLVQQS